jgi:hypothetical protein
MKALVVSLGLLLFVLLAPTSAHAKGIPLIYNTGDHAFATGPLPPPLDKDAELAGYEAGYLCQIKGIMWSYFSVSECKPVVFKGDTYIDDAEVVKVISAKYSEADMKRGLWDHYGWILMALAVVAGVLIWLKEKIAGGSSDASEAPDKAT